MLERHEYEMFRDSVRRLAVDRIEPHAAAVDKEARFPEEALQAFKELQLVGLPVDEEYGGQGADSLAQVIALEEIGRVCATSSVTLMVIWAGMMPIARHGSPEIISQTVKPAMEGDTVFSICLTEAHGGSDVWGAKTRAESRDGGWLLNGQKRYISNATRSEWYTVLARTGEDAFGIFAVHKDDAGVSFGALESKMGIRGNPTADLILDDCHIPEDRCLGEPDRAQEYITNSLTYARPLIGAQALGIAQGAIDASVAYAKERKVFGQKMARFQMVRSTLADLATKVEAARQLLYRACLAAEEGDPEARIFASKAKLFCSNVAMEATTEAVQIHGGAGYLMDFPVERMMRDAKITQIYEGTSDIQKLIISSSMLSD